MVYLDGLLAHGRVLSARDGGLYPPAEVLLSWPPPNYTDPDERGWGGPVTVLVLLAITFLVYIARIWARLVVAKNAGIDDILISFAMIPLFGLAISAVLALRVYGFQWHTWDLPADARVSSRHVTMSIELNYMASTTLIKISILCFYRRMTGNLTNYFVYWVWGSIFFCVIYGVLFTLLITFTCSPVVGYFHIVDITWRLHNELSCRDEGAIIVACASISTLQDLIICMLPIFLIRGLRIQKRQKMALCAIFGVGLVTCVCGILRTYYATYIYYYTYDATWNAYDGWVWTVVEAELGLICASAPALKVFFRRYFGTASSCSGYSGCDSDRTPVPLSRKRCCGGRTPLHSEHSAARSHIIAGGPHDPGVPLDSIKVSQGLDIHVEDRDDQSQRSDTSTKNLNALPMPNQSGWKGRKDWADGCRTVCVALTPGADSRSRSRSRSRERSVESRYFTV